MNESLFQDLARSGVFHLPPQCRKAVEVAAGAAPIKVVAARLEQPEDRESALRDLGPPLGFPAWYGANLDALYDCLTDPDWLPATGQVLLISGLGRLQNADPEGFSLLTDVFRAATDACRDNGTPLWILLDTSAAGLPTLSDL